jgi:hypothetical protein
MSQNYYNSGRIMDYSWANSGGYNEGGGDMVTAGASSLGNMSADLLTLTRDVGEYTSVGGYSSSGLINRGGLITSRSANVVSSTGTSNRAAGLISSGSGGALSAYISEIEQSIIRSSDPIAVNESEEITVNGQRGIWANRAEVVNWRGPIPINQYLINQDSNPEIITKRSNQTLDYVQELAVRYFVYYFKDLASFSI